MVSIERISRQRGSMEGSSGEDRKEWNDLTAGRRPNKHVQKRPGDEQAYPCANPEAGVVYQITHASILSVRAVFVTVRTLWGLAYQPGNRGGATFNLSS